MSAETPVGLAQFPITKFCVIATVAVPLCCSLSNTKYWFLLHNDPFITEYKQYYRFLLFQIGAINESDVALLALLWYHLRQLERAFGSHKYLSLISLCWFYTTVVLVLFNQIVNLVPGIAWNKFTSGSLPLVLALFHFYKEYTPQIYEFEVLLTQPFASSKELKWLLNDQFVVNGLVLLLLVNQGLTGIVSGFVSWVCGVFIDKGLLPGADSWRIPVYKACMNRSPTTMAVANAQQERQAAGSGNGSGRDEADREGGEEEGEEEEDGTGDEPARPLGVQFLDTFRR